MTKLIKLINLPVAIAVSLFAVKCNMGENKDKAVIIDTTSLTNTMATAQPVDHAVTTTISDTAAMKILPVSSTIKPNPAKKGKKGKVSLSLITNKPSGNMDMMDNEGYYTNIYPAYPGGQSALENFFSHNVQYPQDASDNGIEGTVNINFAVDEKGKISAVKTTGSTIGYGLEEEAVRVFKQMPSWIPGSIKGKNVKTRYSLPVRFELAD